MEAMALIEIDALPSYKMVILIFHGELWMSQPDGNPPNNQRFILKWTTLIRSGSTGRGAAADAQTLRVAAGSFETSGSMHSSPTGGVLTDRMDQLGEDQTSINL